LAGQAAAINGIFERMKTGHIDGRIVMRII
jgi:hypothetical protein